MNDLVKRNLLKGLVGLLVLLGLAALGWWAKLEMDYASYEDRKEGIAMRYPRDWNLVDHPQPNVIAVFVAPRRNALQPYRENINISTADLSKNPLTLQQFTETVVKQMTAVFPDTVVDEKSFVNISGHDGVKFFFHAKGNLEIMLIVYAFIYRDIAYTFTYMGMDYQYSVFKPRLDYVMRSVKLFF